MSEEGGRAEWYYVGHFGRMGPLTATQMRDLVREGVVRPETPIWHPGLPEWVSAGQVPELVEAFGQPIPPPSTPPALSGSALELPPIPSGAELADDSLGGVPPSPKSRTLAGFLQILFPGAGRFYLGYHAIGTLQLLTTPCLCLFGWFWSILDGLLILAGSVERDGLGRPLGVSALRRPDRRV